jgi:hypothetical protein
MTRKQSPYFIFAIAIIIMLFVVSIIYITIGKNATDITQLNVNLSFGATIGALIAVALSLISIGYSIKEADVKIYLDQKEVSINGTLQPIKIKNIGNAMGNIAHAFIEIDTPPSSGIMFRTAEGLDFQLTQSQVKKQYRLTIPSNPISLYPGEFIWSLIGFIQVPPEIKDNIKFSVQIVGSQGVQKNNFEIAPNKPNE